MRANYYNVKGRINVVRINPNRFNRSCIRRESLEKPLENPESQDFLRRIPIESRVIYIVILV